MEMKEIVLRACMTTIVKENVKSNSSRRAHKHKQQEVQELQTGKKSVMNYKMKQMATRVLSVVFCHFYEWNCPPF